MSIRETIRDGFQRLKANLAGPSGRRSDVGDEHGSVTAEPRGKQEPGEPESSPRGIGGMDF
ncbi:hypothetical protein ACWDSJ_28645 [Nocardia sp. NPDC003482]